MTVSGISTGRKVTIDGDNVGLATNSKLDEVISAVSAISGGVSIIPAYYMAGRTQITGYDSYSGGGILISARVITGRCWSSSTVGDYVQFKFYGKFVNVIFYEKSGVADIYIDDMTTPYATVDVSALDGPDYNPVWVGPQDLSDDYHTIRIAVNSGTVGVVGVVVDPSKNAWRIRPFPYELDVNLDLAANNAWLSSAGVYVNTWPAYKTAVSTTTALAANGTWTSSSVDCLGSKPYAKKIYITCYSDVDGTIYIDYSPDNSNWDASESISYTGGSTPAITPIEVKGRYVRIRYVNGATDQTTFRLYARFMGD